MGREELTETEFNAIQAKKAVKDLEKMIQSSKITKEELEDESNENSTEHKIYLAKLKKKMEKAQII